MEWKMKKIAILVVVTVLLVGWATIYQKKSSGEDVFAKALAILQNLKSSALTVDQITTLETAYQASVDRITLLNSYITTDETALATEADDYIKWTGTYTIANLKQYARGILIGNPDYDAGIADYLSVTKLPCLAQRPNPGCPEFDKILMIAKRLRATQRELALRSRFIDAGVPWTQAAYTALSYGYIRRGLCTTTSTDTFNLYTTWTVTPYYPNWSASSVANPPTFVQTSDTCGTGGAVTQYRCVEWKYYTDTTKAKDVATNTYLDTNSYWNSYTCPFGCNAGSCNLGRFKVMSNPIKVIVTDTEWEREVSRVSIWQPFIFKVYADRAPTSGTAGAIASEISDTPLTIDAVYKSVTSPGTGCAVPPAWTDFTNQNQSPLTTWTFTCNGTSGTATFTATITLRIKNKDTWAVIATLDKNVVVGPNTMDKFLVDQPLAGTTIRGWDNYTFNIRARGTNGLAYSGFTNQIVLIVDPALPAENNNQKLATGFGTASSGTITVRFPASVMAKTYTIYARWDVFVSDPITVTVLPTQRTATAILGWSANAISITLTDGGSGYTTPPTVTFSNDGNCTTPPTATATVADGVVTGISLASGYSCTTRPTTVTIAAPQ